MRLTVLKFLKMGSSRRVMRVELAAICTLAMALGAVLSIRPPAVNWSADGFFISNAQAEETYFDSEAVERLPSGWSFDSQVKLADNSVAQPSLR